MKFTCLTSACGPPGSGFVGGSRRRSGFRLLAALGLCLIAASAECASATQPQLVDALNALARQTRIELLFDERLARGKRPGPDTGASSPDGRLRSLLAGTGLAFRRTQTGAYLVIVAPSGSAETEPSAVAEPPVAEILVVGRRTINADIRRSADDIQPYEVVEAATIDRAQSSTVEDYLRTRLPQDAETTSLSQSPFGSGGSVRSQIDLRGLGTAQTVVLVDGRRLPSVPGLGSFLQPDVSGLPISGIDRIESIASTSAGIFGIGAAGGAVNFITKSDFRGIDAAVRSGVSDRGDAARRTLSVHLGYTSSELHTRVSVRATRSEDEGLAFGDRSYAATARALRLARNPIGAFVPVSGGVDIAGPPNQDLQLLPAFGGAVLNGSTTFLPLTSTGVAAGGSETLVANAGHLDTSFSADGQGALQSLVTPSKTASVLATVRQDVGDHIVLFVDYIWLRSFGDATVAGLDTRSTFLGVGQAGNPFEQPVTVTYPTIGIVGRLRSRTTTDRLTVGGVAQLGGTWSTSIDGAIGHARIVDSSDRLLANAADIDVFDGIAALSSQLAAQTFGQAEGSRARNRLRDFNVKIAGSPLRLPAGPTSLTITAEEREEVAPGEVDEYHPLADEPAVSETNASQKQRVASLFAEVRVPVLAKDIAFAPLRALEFQIAPRYDRYALTVPVTSTDIREAGLYGSQASARHGVPAITAGARADPFRDVMIRASFAAGYTPPTSLQITPEGFSTFPSALNDPKRGGAQPFTTDQLILLYGGSPRLRPQRTETLTVGAVVRPSALPGLRVSVDYTNLRTSHEIADYAQGDFQYFVDNEAAFPGRVVRAPLTAADAAQGFTGGRIVLVDASYLAVGRSDLKAADVAFDYDRKTTIGRFGLYARLTWEPVLSHRGRPDLLSYNSVGSVNGPLAIRGNAGMDWSGDVWSAGINVQFYGSSRVTYSFQSGSAYASLYQEDNAINVLEQGGAKVAAQAYLDGYVGFEAHAPFLRDGRTSMRVRLGLKNILGNRPPIVVTPQALDSNAPGYSTLGDPRGRTFVLDVSTAF